MGGDLTGMAFSKLHIYKVPESEAALLCVNEVGVHA